jgi:hypothetical protein
MGFNGHFNTSLLLLYLPSQDSPVTAEGSSHTAPDVDSTENTAHIIACSLVAREECLQNCSSDLTLSTLLTYFPYFGKREDGLAVCSPVWIFPLSLLSNGSVNTSMSCQLKLED